MLKINQFKKVFAAMMFIVAINIGQNVWASGGTLIGEGTNANPYIISDLADWNFFAGKLNDGTTVADYAKKCYKLVADIGPVTVMASTYYNYPFRGNFNGNGHTITIALSRDTNPGGSDHNQGLALFQYAGNGCNIHDLHVTGTIETCGKFAAGFIAYIPNGDSSNSPRIVSISRCRSSVTITSTVEGDATSAGFVGASKKNVNLVLNNCLFDGAFVSSTATQFSGMVGWQDGTGHANILNSLVKPGAGMSLTAPDGNHYTFCRHGGESFGMINSYYYNAIGTAQGNAVGSMGNDDLKNALGAAWLVQNDAVVPYAISYHYTLIDNYTATEANVAGNVIPDNGALGYAKFVDGDKSTYWTTCPTDWTPCYMNFQSETPFVLKGYVLTMAPNIQNNPNHNPTEWYLRGKNAQGNWEVIDHRDENLPAMNSAEKVYVLADNTKSYQQFRFEVISVRGWDSNGFKVFAMAELQLFGLLDNNDLANACISGVSDFYMWNSGNAIDVNCTVTDYNGSVLTKGTDYTQTITNADDETVTEVTDAGFYTLTINGAGSYTGTKSVGFTVTDHPTGLSWNEFASEYYINLPKNRQTVIDLNTMTPAFTTPFKVYDDRGKNINFTQGCSEDLLVVAPEGYVLQVCGTIDLGDETLLEFYDGTWGENLMAGNFNRCIGDDIGFLITTGPQLAIKYNTSTKTRRAGLDLTVIPVQANTKSNITINDDEHGSVTASVNNSMVTKATVNSLVTLTATPADGYMPNGFTVKDTQGHNIPVTGGWYTDNTATFTMPGSAVTITPNFVTTAYPTELSINIPRYSSSATDALVATIPEGVECFKIYDNGGPSNNYSYSSNGYLLLEAPEGKVIQLTTDNLDGISTDDQLEVFDGNTTDHPLGGPYSWGDDLGTLTSTGNQMLLHFVCNGNYYSTNAGLNLLARVYDTSTQFAITVTPSEHGTVAVSPASSASVSSTVTLTFTANEGYTGYRAMDFITNYPSVTVDGGWYSDNVMTFSMPAGPVTVTPNYTRATTAEEGLYVNMPKKNTYATSRMVNIPAGVSSFKVYDDGGYDGIYSDFCDGYMILTAPEDNRIKLTGTVECQQGTDYLEVYDGNTTDQLIGRYDDDDIGTIYSSGQSLLLHFQSNIWNQFAFYEGLNLKVEKVTSSPSPYLTFSGFTATAGQNGYNPSAESESWSSLVDNTTNTIWRTHNDTGEGFRTCYVEFEHTEPIVPKKYFLMTGNQTKQHPGRLPKSWILKGKLNGEDNWTTIATVEDDGHLLPINNYAFEYSLEENNHAYQYFHFEVSAVQGHEPGSSVQWDDYIMELNELYFKGYRAENVQNDLAYATISGVQSRYLYSGNTFNVNPIVKDFNGNTLNEGEHYLTAISPNPVQNPGDYTLTISAKDGGGYTGNQTVHFKVTDYPLGVEVDDDFESPDQLGYYYVNLPKTGLKSIPLGFPAGFHNSIKIYDDGGKNNNYSKECHGALALTVPNGYVLQLTGTVTCKAGSDYLEIFDNTHNFLGKDHYGNEDGEDIGTLTSTTEALYISFTSDDASTRIGVDLTLSIIPTTEAHSISFDYVVGGTATATPNSACVGSTVTLTPSSNPGYLIYDFIAKDTYDHEVDVDGNWYGNSTFTMPGSEVTVTPLTTHRLSYLGGLYVDMKLNDTKTVNIPEGVSSFKVYDNGGKDGDYVGPCDDIMIINAPDGYVLRIEGSGDYNATGDPQSLSVYDGTTLMQSYDGGNNVNIGPLTTSGNQMQLQFNNCADGGYGLDLTVTVYKPNCWGVGTDGTTEHPYEISDMDGLQTLAALSESDSFAGKNFKLTANIGTAENPFRKVIGDNKDYPFCGIFDGNGHTITMALTNENVFDGADEAEQGTALFHYAGNGCDIKNLTIDGTINTANKFAGSLIAYIKPGQLGNPKAIALSNCHSRVVITSTKSGDNTTGGFIGLVKEHVALTLIKCVFDGAFISAEGTQFSGFVGYQAKQVETNIRYGIMAADITGLGVQNGNHYTFCRYNGQGTLTFNEVNYYHNALGTAQGTQAYRLTLPSGVTVTRDSGSATGNDEAYVYTNGFNIGECPYYTSDASVTIDPISGFIISSASIHYGENGYVIYDNMFNMPASDATITATLGVTITVEGYSSFPNGKWVFLALPAIPEGGSVNPTTIENLTTNEASQYDLYRFNQSADKEWENFKSWSTNGFTTMTHGRGYLYARRYTGTILFTGTFLTTESHEVALDYDANAHLKGCNLVGNPFPVAAYVDRPYYKMNEIGTDIEVVENYWANSIPACTGVVVIANGTDEHVTFSTTAPEAPVTATGDNGSLQMTLTKANERGNAFQDKAIVSFNQDAQLSKFIFNEDHAKLYLPKNNNDYAIISSDKQEEIQVYFKTKEFGKYTINFDVVEMCHGASLQGARLIDKLTGNEIDLGIDEEYTFIGTPADRRDRFVIRFAASESSETSEVFAYQSGSDIIVNGEGTLQIFDVMGRLVMTKRVNGEETINLKLNGVYVLKMNEKVQKIVVR